MAGIEQQTPDAVAATVNADGRSLTDSERYAATMELVAASLRTREPAAPGESARYEAAMLTDERSFQVALRDRSLDGEYGKRVLGEATAKPVDTDNV